MKKCLLASLVIAACLLPAQGAADAPGPAGTAPPPDLSWLMAAPEDAAVSACCVTSRVKCEQTCLRPPNCGVAEFTCNATSLTSCQPTCRCFFCE